MKPSLVDVPPGYGCQRPSRGLPRERHGCGRATRPVHSNQLLRSRYVASAKTYYPFYSSAFNSNVIEYITYVITAL